MPRKAMRTFDIERRRLCTARVFSVIFDHMGGPDRDKKPM